MKKLKRYLLLAAALVITACSTIGVNGPRFQETAQSGMRTDAALVYVYRVGQWTDIRVGSVQISVGGKFVLGLKDQGFTSFYVGPGKHQFRAEWSFMEKPLFEGGHFEPKTLAVDVEAGKTYYINYLIQEDGRPTTYMEQSSLLGKSLSKSHVLFAGLVEENETVGLKNLPLCKQQTNDFE